MLYKKLIYWTCDTYLHLFWNVYPQKCCKRLQSSEISIYFIQLQYYWVDIKTDCNASYSNYYFIDATYKTFKRYMIFQCAFTLKAVIKTMFPLGLWPLSPRWRGSPSLSPNTHSLVSTLCLESTGLISSCPLSLFVSHCKKPSLSGYLFSCFLILQGSVQPVLCPLPSSWNPSLCSLALKVCHHQSLLCLQPIL